MFPHGSICHANADGCEGSTSVYFGHSDSRATPAIARPTQCRELPLFRITSRYLVLQESVPASTSAQSLHRC